MSVSFTRIVRRETHSSRSVGAITVAVILIALVIWLAVEAVVSMLGLPALLMSPHTILSSLVAAPATSGVVLAVIASALAIIGFALLVLGILPGRRDRRQLAAETATVVSSDGLLASALARRVAHEASLSPDAVVVSLGHRSGTIRLRPVSGVPLDRERIAEAAQDEFDTAQSNTHMRLRVQISPEGKVGS